MMVAIETSYMYQEAMCMIRENDGQGKFGLDWRARGMYDTLGGDILIIEVFDIHTGKIYAVLH